MGVLTRISDSIGITSAQAREDRQARAMLESHVRKLTSEYHQLRESVSIADLRPIMPWERFYDGDRLLFPSGQSTDRKHGREWPILKDEQDLRQMRGFSRLLCETNSYAIGFRDHVRNFVVGPGFTWQVVLAGQQTGATSTGMVDKDGDGKPDADPDVLACQQVLDEFCRLNNWGDSGEATVSQDLDQPVCAPVNRERETYERAMEDGEVVQRLFHGDASTKGVPHLRFVEPECMTCPPNQDQNGDWSFGALSVEGDVEQIRAYHFADPLRPGEMGEIVPAGHVLHFKLNSKSTVKRGIPDFWPIEDELTGSRTLVRNMLKVSGILSAIAYIRQHAPTTLPEQVRQLIDKSSVQTAPGTVPQGARTPYGLAGPDATRYMSVHQAGLIIDISNQLQYQPGPINNGVPGFLQAQQSALRCVGLRWGCPEYFSGDASNANFASTLVAGGPFERATTTRQQDYKLYQQSLAIRVLLFAVASGRLRREQVARVAVRVTTPPVAIANRNEDTNRRRTLFDAKVLSPQTWIAEEGYDPAIEAANIKAWAEQFPDDAGAGMGAMMGGGGGDDGGLGSLFGESRTLWEGFTGMKRDSRGRKIHYVDGKRVKGDADYGNRADKAKAAEAERETLVAKAIQNIDQLNPEQFESLANVLQSMTGDRLKELARGMSLRVSGTKSALASRLLSSLRRNRNDDTAYGSALRDAPAKKRQEFLAATRGANESPEAFAHRHYPELKSVKGVVYEGVDSPQARINVHDLSMMGGAAKALGDAGVEVYISDLPVPKTDQMQRLAGVSPRSWPSGKTWDTVAGCYDTDNKKTIAGKGEHGSTSLLTHEHGHAIGHVFDLDNDKDLIKFHEDLYAAGKLDTYLGQGGPGSRAGRQELFAESTAVYYSLGYDEVARKLSPAYAKWLHKNLMAIEAKGGSP